MKRFFGGISFYILVFIAILLFTSINYTKDTTQQKVYSDLVAEIKAGNVKQLDIYDDSVEAKLQNDEKIKVSLLHLDALYKDAGAEINKSLEGIPPKMKIEHHVPLAPPWWMTLLSPLVLIILVVIFWLFILPGAQGGGRSAMNFGKTKARVNMEGQKRVTFNEVAGADEEKEELQELVEFLKSPLKFVEIGARIPKGVLLVGPPGTGKTLLAKAVAGEAEVPFFSISGSDFVEMYVGVGASRVRDLFEQAKKNQPCIIFIDEIDAVGRHRGAGLGGGHDEREQTLNQLLVEMDGFGNNEGVIIIAATNRPDILDPALLRPGRFDRRVEVSYPDIRGREEILIVHSREKPLAEDVNLKVIARATVGFTGADLENLLNEAAILTARHGKQKITMESIEQSKIKVLMGPEKKSRIVSEKDKRITAYHEAGHAVVTHFLPTLDPVHHITIIPRGKAGGFTEHLRTEDKSHWMYQEMKETLIVLLGGRMAEKLVIGDISTGASNDIQRVTGLARQMVTRFGMSDLLGPIAFGSDNDEVFLGREFAHTRNYSENVAAEIDKEIKRLIDEAFQTAETILKQNMDKLHEVANTLLEEEKIDGEKFESIMGGKKISNRNSEADREIQEAPDVLPEIKDHLTGDDEGNTQAGIPDKF